VPSASAAQIRINELLADPASDWDGDGDVNSRNDEWLEIVNVGSSSVDLSEYVVTDASGGTAWRFGFSGMLAPGDFVVVYGSDALAWQSVNGFPSQGLSLNNGGDSVLLYRIANAETTLVDQVDYESFAVLDDRSTGMLPDGSGPRVVFDELNPYTGSTPPLGTACPPTPGMPNGCTVLPTEHSTWGAVKDRYKD